MNAHALDSVLDASVGIKLFVAEALSERATALVAQAVNEGARLHVPDLFFIECANVFWKYVRRFGHPADAARHYLSELGRLNLQRTSTADLIVQAFEIAVASEITAYDACYVALAYRLDIPLITADDVLFKRATAAGYRVRWLGAL